MDVSHENTSEQDTCGRYASSFELPREHETHAVHAQLSAGINASRKFRMVEVLPAEARATDG